MKADTICISKDDKKTHLQIHGMCTYIGLD